MSPPPVASITYPPNILDIFAFIDQRIRADPNFPFTRNAIAQVGIEEARTRHVFMRDIRYRDWVEWGGEQASQEWRERVSRIQTYTAEDFWRNLLECKFDEFGRKEDGSSELRDFATFLDKSRFPPIIDLGDLFGKSPLGLALGTGLLQPFVAVPDGLRRAWHGGKGVGYAEEGEYYRVMPDQRGVLRRYWEVGCILLNHRPGPGWDDWKVTGHVLVIDLDSAEHDPWIILAKEWDDDEEEPETFTAPDEVDKDDASALGVFPGREKRTTVAKLLLCGLSSKVHDCRPLLLQFGTSCQLDLAERHGGELGRGAGGPRLARMMTWYRREDGREVCLDEAERVCMMRDPVTGAYSLPAEGERVDYSEGSSAVERAGL